MELYVGTFAGQGKLRPGMFPAQLKATEAWCCGSDSKSIGPAGASLRAKVTSVDPLSSLEFQTRSRTGQAQLGTDVPIRIFQNEALGFDGCRARRHRRGSRRAAFLGAAWSALLRLRQYADRGNCQQDGQRALLEPSIFFFQAFYSGQKCAELSHFAHVSLRNRSDSTRA